MKVLVVLCIATCCIAVADSNLWQFSRMIQCVTRHGSLDFNDYGCWCGKGGSGTPLDAIDRCCQAHDRCYDASVARGCSPKLVTYDWDNDHCPQAQCTDRPSCDRQACECDLEASRCFLQHKYTYNKSLKGVDKKSRC